MTERMEQVLNALDLCSFSGFYPDRGATAAELAMAERRLRRKLPPEIHQFYRRFNGGGLVGSNIQLWPMADDKVGSLTIATASDLLRGWKWEIPEEVVVIGGDGSDGTYGLWIPESVNARPLVIEIGESFELPAFAITGDSFGDFLAGRMAYYLLSFRDDGYDVTGALDALGVPSELRSPAELDDDCYFSLLNWANPHLPDKTPDPYQRGWSLEQIAEFANDQ